jgi:hypothetical protein
MKWKDNFFKSTMKFGEKSIANEDCIKYHGKKDCV